MSDDISILEKLCLGCGLCCNGVLFADVRLQPGDDAQRLRALGLPLSALRGGGRKEQWKCNQPCPALKDGACRVYRDRPSYCRQFECALFKGVESDRVDIAAALRLVRTARQRATRVLQLLEELGETTETLSLSKRFRRAQRRMETLDFTEGEADLFGQLTLAMHDLNFLLSQKFYPGE